MKAPISCISSITGLSSSLDSLIVIADVEELQSILTSTFIHWVALRMSHILYPFRDQTYPVQYEYDVEDA